MLLIAWTFFMIGNRLHVGLRMLWIDPYFSTLACLTMIYWLYKREQTYCKTDFKVLFYSAIFICCFCISTKTFIPLFGIFRWCVVPTSADTMDIIRIILMLQGLLRSGKNDFSFSFAINLLIMVMYVFFFWWSSILSRYITNIIIIISFPFFPVVKQQQKRWTRWFCSTCEWM